MPQKEQAHFKGAIRDKFNPYITELLYEYRGITYFVTSYKNGYSETLVSQHKEAQEKNR